MQRKDIENGLSIYIEGRKKLDDHFSQFSNFADSAVLLCTEE